MNIDFGDYVTRRKTGIVGERGGDNYAFSGDLKDAQDHADAQADRAGGVEHGAARQRRAVRRFARHGGEGRAESVPARLQHRQIVCGHPRHSDAHGVRLGKDRLDQRNDHGHGQRVGDRDSQRGGGLLHGRRAALRDRPRVRSHSEWARGVPHRAPHAHAACKRAARLVRSTGAARTPKAGRARPRSPAIARVCSVAGISRWHSTRS